MTVAGLTELTDNQQSVDMERSKSPTSGNLFLHTYTHMHKSLRIPWSLSAYTSITGTFKLFWDAVDFKLELQPVVTSPVTIASSPDDNGTCLN